MYVFIYFVKINIYDNIVYNSQLYIHQVRAEISAEASAWVEAATRTWALDAPACLGSAKLSQRAASYRLEIWLRASPPKHLPRPQDPPPYNILQMNSI